MGLARLALKTDELLDTVVFGDAVSEAAHELRATSSNASSRCAQGLPCRRGGAGASLKFRLAVEPQAQNFITVKFDGSEVDSSSSLVTAVNESFAGAVSDGGYPPELNGCFGNSDRKW